MRDPNQSLLIFVIFLLLNLYQMINILASSSSPPPPPQADTPFQCPDHQRYALALLHQNLKVVGDYSSHAELWDWDLKTNCCSWPGVTCNGDGLVTELFLGPIFGTILEIKLENPILEMVFQNLSFLVEVNLDDVDLSAQSSSWCEAISHLLPNLRHLSLSDCSLSGPICSSLFTLPSLEQLDLTSNKFSGELSEFPNASSSLLELLYLSQNSLVGPIPRSIFELPRLAEVDLRSNNFYGYLKLGNFRNQRNLKDLRLSGVSVESDNTSLASVQLKFLTLTSCNLTEFPDFLKAQNSLTYLDLSNNQIKGYVPSWIWKKNLETLDLSHNLIDFPKYSSFGMLNNSFNCDATSTFSHLSLRMRSCDLSSFPEFLKNQSNLGELDLSHNKLKGQIPNWIWNNPSLRSLNLSENSLLSFDQISPALIQVESLQILDLRDNLLHGSFPKAICNFSALRLLDMSCNHLSSQIPDCLGDIPSLNVLHLQRNNFNTMPGFSQSGNLQSLKMHCNKIEGKLPRSLANCSKLEVLDLGDNMIRDAFPMWLEKLKVLNLSHNSFVSTIPSLMRNLTELESLDLSNNKLSGEIPPQLTGLTFLEVINLSYNQLEGSIPQGNQFGTFPNTSYEGNPRLCGPPLTRTCDAGAVPMPPPVLINDEDSWTKYILDWKIVGMGYGSGVVIGFSIGYTVFSQMRIKWFSDLERQARKHGRRFRQR